MKKLISEKMRLQEEQELAKNSYKKELDEKEQANRANRAETTHGSCH